MNTIKANLSKPFFLFYRKTISDCFTGSVPKEFTSYEAALLAWEGIEKNGCFVSEDGKTVEAFSGYVTMAITPAIIEE